MPNKIVQFKNKNRRPLEVLNKTAEAADVYIYDEIGGWGITADSMVAFFKGIDSKTINLHINSPGGSVFDGVTIYNMLNAHGSKIIVHVDGLAASIASIIAMAGDEIIMAENSMMMIHNPMAVVGGNAGELRKLADVLDQLKGTMVATYAARTGLKPEDIGPMMDAETWMNAADAKAKGFATSVTEAKKVAACWDADTFTGCTKTPKNFISAPEDESRPALDARRLRQAALEK